MQDPIIAAAISAVIASILAVFLVKLMDRLRKMDAESQAKDILERAERDVANRRKEYELELKELALKQQAETEKELGKTRKELHERERHFPGTRLPMGWGATSDSIAARVADCTGAAELILLKSALPEADGTYASAAQDGYVDRFFPQAAAWAERVRCVNLRDAATTENWLKR